MAAPKKTRSAVRKNGQPASSRSAAPVKKKAPAKAAAAAKTKPPVPAKPALKARLPAASRSALADPLAIPVVPVVGIVASAGGLESFVKFLEVMPAASGMALVFVPHLDPGRASMMAEVLARHSSMPVSTVVHGEALKPNHVYVIPSNKYLEVHDGKATLSGPVQRNSPLNPIDHFLSSLAFDQQDNAVAIVLSGTGALGTVGIQAIKGNGGMVMVQSPESAFEKGMPQSAIDTGLADYILPPDEMPKLLLAYAEHFFQLVPAASAGLPTQGDHLAQILALLRARTRFDFHAYRKQMLMRRTHRRMAIKNLDNMAQYVTLLRDTPDELVLLAKDLLISVTQFFRDPEVFAALQTDVIPDLMRDRSAESPLRVWIPACATGEEAYSITMLLLEAIAASGKACPLQVFATDIDADALDVARRGIYAEALLANISPERLGRFFVKLDGQRYQVAPTLRDAVLFAQHDVLSDAPFSKVDLVSCRNLLIYIETAVQQKIISIFHFALNEGGYLVLGPSESIGARIELFDPVSKKWRIYRRAWLDRRPRVEFPIVPVLTRPEVRVTRALSPTREPTTAEIVQKILVQEFAPCAVLIRRNYEVLYFHGSTADFFGPPSGKPSTDLIALITEGLRSRVRAAVHKAIRDGKRVTMSGARIKRGKRYLGVRVSVLPVSGRTVGEDLLLVTFEEESEPAAEVGKRGTASIHQDDVVRQLERELKQAREDLRGTIEDLESANEELTGSNEEMMSMNEELQSANEEMESSKEELQSLNEELTTLNAQLLEKMIAIEEANNDLSNLLASVDTATIFLDVDFAIKRFTAAATRVFRLIPGDVGRPISDIKGLVVDPDLEIDVHAVLEALAPREKEVVTNDGRRYLRRVTPYRTSDNRIEGVVLTFTDISGIAQSSS